MLNFEEVKHSCTIVSDVGFLSSGDHFVHASRAKSGFDDFNDSLNGIDVAEDLALAG